MPDPLRLGDLDLMMSLKFREEAWLHDEPGIKIREWLSFPPPEAGESSRICRKGRCRILAHAVREG